MTEPLFLYQGVQPLAVMTNISANKYYARAISAIGGDRYMDACQVREAALRKRGSLFPVQQPPAPSATDSLDDWLAEARTATTAEWERAADVQALSTLIDECDRNIGNLGADFESLCRSLAADFAELMGSVAEVVGELNGARTPSQVIERGVTEAWKRLPALRREYDQLRAAQEMVVGSQPEWQWAKSNVHHADPLASDMALSNLDDVFPGWKDGGEVPWPTDPIEQLVWLCASEAQPWIPTLAQLHELGRHRLDRANPLPTVTPGRPDKPRRLLNRSSKRVVSIGEEI